MATNTYVALDKVTVGTATPSITFSSIPSTYTDLVVVAGNVTVSNDGYALDFKINGDTGSNYSLTNISGNGSTTRSDRVSNGTNTANDLDYYYGFSSSTPGSSILHFMNYSNTTTYKTVLARTSSSAKEVEASVHLWRSTSAITSIEIGAAGSNIAAGSTFSLYGIAASSVGAKATGGTVYTDSLYYYHAFTGSGTFTPTQSITADMLCVAGGGGTGINFSGGGGAGGIVLSSSQSLTAQGYTVTVGAGGPSKSVSTGSSLDMNGTNSNVTGGSLSLTAAVGGGGGGLRSGTGQGGTANIGAGGGSAGGTAYDGGGTSFATGTAGQGNNGGKSLGTVGEYGTGGGGGAGSVGADGTDAIGGAGGAGSTAYPSWLSATGLGVNGFIAGGGGGSGETLTTTGGAGGGGAGVPTGTANNGVANTGGGAGGKKDSTGSGAAGGSGVVIIRYLKA